jgi:Domain of unknown function (DUF222)/HNH endonuclease
VDETLAHLRDLMVSLSSARLYAFSDAQLQSAMESVRAAIGCLSGVAAALTHEAVARQLPETLGYASTGSWLRHAHRLSHSEASTAITLGNVVEERPRLGEAVSVGLVSGEQAIVIGEALSRLSARVDASTVDAAEARLLDDARSFGPADLKVLADRVLAHVAPDIADEELRRRLEESERRAYADRALTLSVDRVSQQTRISGRLPAEMGAILAAALAPLAKRRPRFAVGAAVGPRLAEDLLIFSPANQQDARLSVADDLTEPPHAIDDRTASQRRADALIELCRVAGAGRDITAGCVAAAGRVPGRSDDAGDDVNGGADVPGGSPTAAGRIPRRPTGRSGVTINVTVDYDVLNQQLGVGMLDNAQLLTPESARRIGCDAGVLPAVMNSAGQVLDFGRTQRLWGGAARRAIILRDRGCVFPACDRPPEYTDIHHIKHWSRGGRTDLSNGALLCGFHHHLIHHGDWQIRMGVDGLPDVIPPVYIDPERKPLRNRYHRRP